MYIVYTSVVATITEQRWAVARYRDPPTVCARFQGVADGETHRWRAIATQGVKLTLARPLPHTGLGEVSVYRFFPMRRPARERLGKVRNLGVPGLAK